MAVNLSGGQGAGGKAARVADSRQSSSDNSPKRKKRKGKTFSTTREQYDDRKARGLKTAKSRPKAGQAWKAGRFPGSSTEKARRARNKEDPMSAVKSDQPPGKPKRKKKRSQPGPSAPEQTAPTITKTTIDGPEIPDGTPVAPAPKVKKKKKKKPAPAPAPAPGLTAAPTESIGPPGQQAVPPAPTGEPTMPPGANPFMDPPPAPQGGKGGGIPAGVTANPNDVIANGQPVSQPAPAQGGKGG